MSTPRKPRKPKSRKINVSDRSKWETILKTVTKDEVPVELLESLTVNLSDGTAVTINIRELIDNGATTTFIENQINDKLELHSDEIEDIDFFICIDSVAKAVQPVTDHILKDL
jgi:hypothetical protein